MWHSRLRILLALSFSCLSHCYGVGLIPGLGISTCHRHNPPPQKKERNNEEVGIAREEWARGFARGTEAVFWWNGK